MIDVESITLPASGTDTHVQFARKGDTALRDDDAESRSGHVNTRIIERIGQRLRHKTVDDDGVVVVRHVQLAVDDDGWNERHQRPDRLRQTVIGLSLIHI